MSYTMPTFPVNYVALDEDHEWQVENNWIPPVVGSGVIDGRGNRYRIVDVWTNHEKHGGGVGEYGVYAYLRLAKGEDDLPGNRHSYYTSGI